jgi:hypothetical protein
VRDIFHRVGATELAVAKLETRTDVHEVRLDDHEPRIRKNEHLIAKIIGACIAGSALGNVILSLLRSG